MQASSSPSLIVMARMPVDRRPSRDHRYRVRWLDFSSPWFRYEMFAPGEAADIVAGTGWRVERVLDDGSPRWGMVLEKADPHPETGR